MAELHPVICECFIELLNLNFQICFHERSYTDRNTTYFPPLEPTADACNAPRFFFLSEIRALSKEFRGHLYVGRHWPLLLNEYSLNFTLSLIKFISCFIFKFFLELKDYYLSIKVKRLFYERYRS